VRELGVIGELAVGASNVREALVRVAASLPFHTTHEIITVGSTKGGLFVREAWGLRMDAETRHFVQQYAAALIQALCTNAGTLPPIFDRMALMPHPVHGLDHLRACFGDNVVASPNNLLELFVPDDVADRPLPFGVMAPPAWDHSRDLIPLRGDGTLSASVRIIMAAMLLSDKPTVERVAHAAGTSIRTFQRRLLAEKTTFSDLLETVRRDLALAGLATGNTSAGAIAGALGYGQQSSLTRAVRRWTGTPPRSIARGPKS
jgi:AraC-like DNA-binding protein